jgi:hypothetical protein
MDASKAGKTRETHDSLDPDSPPSAEEVADAEALRDALESSAANDAADFARAVSLAHAPRPIDGSEHAALVERAIARGEARRNAPRRMGGRARSALAIAGGLALAAAITLVATRVELSGATAKVTPSIEPLIPVRSTQALFREPFARAGGESGRIDRIAWARAGDLRDNRFSEWGVR